MTPSVHPVQAQIARELAVSPHFDVDRELERRTAFLAGELAQSRGRALVLGISGGVDSLTAGVLCQRAVERVRGEGLWARFIAVRLPYATQRDDADAAAALEFIGPDEVVSVDIAPAVDATVRALIDSGQRILDPQWADFVAGNLKARQRMVVQYAIANAERGLVVGTDHAAEAVMGFFTKHGDGACDLAPLFGLTKRRVRALATRLGAPVRLVEKVPTADLESLQPLRPDEDVLGCTYAAIDDFLEGYAVEDDTARHIIATYLRTAHKRAGPRTPLGLA